MKVFCHGNMKVGWNGLKQSYRIYSLVVSTDVHSWAHVNCLVLTFCLKDDYSLLYRSLDTKRTSLSLWSYIKEGSNKYTQKKYLQKKYPYKKYLCSYVATLFRFAVRFARVRILNTTPGDSRELLVSDSESGFPFDLFGGQFLCWHISDHFFCCSSIFICFLALISHVIYLFTRKGLYSSAV